WRNSARRRATFATPRDRLEAIHRDQRRSPARLDEDSWLGGSSRVLPMREGRILPTHSPMIRPLGTAEETTDTVSPPSPWWCDVASLRKRGRNKDRRSDARRNCGRNV